MTQEEKQLLLRDLCGRLPYGVKVTYNISGDHFGTISKICNYETNYGTFKMEHGYNVGAYSIKPYLRPMSSMTEEEREYLSEELGFDENLENGELNDFGSYVYNRVNVLPLFDWLNKNMFDYHGLIPMGLALEAPEDMYKNE